MRADKAGRGPLHGRRIKRRGDAVGIGEIKRVVNCRVADAVGIGFGVGRVAGVETFRHFGRLPHPDIRRQVGVEGQRQPPQRHMPSIVEAQRETPRMDAGVGARAPFDIRPAAEHGLHRVLQSLADGRRVGLHLEARIPGALIGKPE